MIERRPQAAMVVIFERNEAERLQHTVTHFPRRAEDFSHAVHGPGLRLKSNFDEVALAQRMSHPQQAAGHRDGLEFSFSAPAVF